ncbi:S-adenosyl-L-methionine-dependent methyltransferase [Xylariales sp. PMI_506]|nr:S-adenosyl-L-methionine-dependent methyltransferase [Xylariales sp. PMI_506]
MADNVYAVASSSFWEDYTRGRPTPPDSFWARLFDYHAAHGGEFGTVFDLGAGAGIHSPELARRFARVILGDPGQENLDVARKVLGSDPKYEFHSCTGESASLPDRSVDMVFIGTALHWMDPNAAIENVARMLKPGGTLAVAVFGHVAYFNDSKVYNIFGQLISEAMKQVRKGLEVGNPSMAEKVKRSTEMQDTGYDSVAIPDDYFREGVERVKLNVEGRDKPLVLVRTIEKQYVSRVSANDRIIVEEDSAWTFDMDLQGVRDHFNSFPFGKLDSEPLSQLWHDLEVAGKNGRYQGVWPASIILATRK